MIQSSLFIVVFNLNPTIYMYISQMIKSMLFVMVFALWNGT
jgi:hypothetical protein